MNNIGLPALMAIMLGSACSDVPGTHQRQDTIAAPVSAFVPASRTRVEGQLLGVGAGGRLGLIDVQRPTNSDRLFAETMFLQRPVPGSPDAMSQVTEVDCSSRTHRIIANLTYKRDGGLVDTVWVETTFTDTPILQQVYDTICDDSYMSLSVAQFESIEEFLDLFDLF